ncbi:hypothetical protein AOL_s00075g163 [Orbilia oligospora ATCC 24927]|uniref:Uncharacterized protein n=1 Tax=Arthrobotrys oligospora (strain ATCC 24927 / CBS 115.81 / DSM 1491) TaxID=756982 RepID=G1X8G4_ARTOA|nr:hypothetical protein AOL_s00075g163 [Orbilia oligospora ATCC 24927]EGX50527.1 hypothetical protein AOL_s00075g163 [Orbilia oligospora ATCC 24927]
MFSILKTLSKVYCVTAIYIFLIAPNPLFSVPTPQDLEAANEAITDKIASVPRQNPPKNSNETAQDGRATTGPNSTITYSQELEGTKSLMPSMLSISPRVDVPESFFYQRLSVDCIGHQVVIDGRFTQIQDFRIPPTDYVQRDENGEVSRSDQRSIQIRITRCRTGCRCNSNGELLGNDDVRTGRNCQNRRKIPLKCRLLFGCYCKVELGERRSPIEGATVEDFERSFNNLPDYVQQRLGQIDFRRFARPSVRQALDGIEPIGSLDESVLFDGPAGFVGEPLGFVDQPIGFVDQPIGFVDQPAIGFVGEPVAGQADNLNVAPLPLYGMDGGDPCPWELGAQEALGLDPNELGLTNWPGFSPSDFDYWNHYGGGSGGGSGGGYGGGYGGGADSIAKRSTDSKLKK